MEIPPANTNRSKKGSCHGLTGGHLLARNVIWSVIGAGAPLIVGLYSIPIVVAKLGLERFGILSLAWMFVGYFSLFDFGVGRAITQIASEHLGRGQLGAIRVTLNTALSVSLLISLAGCVIALGLVPVATDRVFNIPAEISQEARNAMYLLALSVPVVVISAVYKAILEAQQRFAALNIVKVFLGISTFAGPLLAVQLNGSLSVVMATLIIGRVAALGSYVWLCHQTSFIWTSLRVTGVEARKLLSFGGWMTVSNTISPIMVYFDRFIIGSTLTMAAVSYYTVPYEIVIKLLIVPAAVAAVIFPALSTAFVDGSGRAPKIYRKSVKYTFMAMFPIVVLVLTLADYGLSWWINDEFSRSSSMVLQLLAIGVFVNALAHIPFATIQARGRADLTAVIHLVELPVYIGVLWWSIQEFGINGAAGAWLFRACLDGVLLFYVSHLVLRKPKINIGNLVITTGWSMGTLAGLVFWSGPLIIRVVVGFLVILLFAAYTWTQWLTPGERNLATRPRTLLETRNYE